MSKACLLIDDEIDSVNDMLVGWDNYIDGETISYKCIAPCIDSRGIDLSQTISAIQSYIAEQHPSIIACDFDLSDNDIWGIDIIAEIRKIRPASSCLLYSANLDKVCRHVHLRTTQKSDESDSGAADECVNILKALAFTKEFFKRDILEAKVKEWLLKPESAHGMIARELMKYPNAVLTEGYFPLHGKKFSEIEREVTNETKSGKCFVIDIIRSKIASLTENPFHE
jgi:hypothetical protein